MGIMNTIFGNVSEMDIASFTIKSLEKTNKKGQMSS